MAERSNCQDALPHENDVKMSESVANYDYLESSEKISDNERSLSLPGSDGVNSLNNNCSTDHSVFASSTNVSESGIEIVSCELNNLNDETPEPNIIASDDSNATIIDEFENHAPENADDDCYVVASFKQSTPSSHRNSKSGESEDNISFVEFVDLTQDEPTETKFEDSFVQEFTKDTRLCILLDVIPDADIDFLKIKVNELKTDEDLQLFVLNALETHNYPKIGAIKNNFPKETGESIRGLNSELNEEALGSRSLKIENASISEQTALNEDNIVTPHFADQDHSTAFDATNREKSIKNSPVLTASVPHTVTGPHAFATHPPSNSNYRFTIANMEHQSWQRYTQSQVAIMGAKPHTVTSQEASHNHTSSNIPQTVTSSSHTEAKSQRVSVQDIRASQQGIEMPDSTYIPVRRIISSTQTDRDRPLNLTVNVPPYPYPPTKQVRAPNTRAPHSTYITTSVLPQRPITLRDNFFQNARDWLPLNINIFNPRENMNTLMEQRRRYIEERYARIAAADFLHTNAVEEFVNYLTVSMRPKERPKESPKESENTRFNLLFGILPWADPEFLKREANNLKTDDDVEKFLIRAIANDELWNKCVTAKNSTQKILSGQSDYKYRILLELLPDASPTFLKRESVKLKNDEEIHEFALKLSREQAYPKRKSPSGSSKTKSNKRKNEIKDLESINPKYHTLLDMLPDADPDFLLQESKMLGNSDDLEKFVLKAVEENAYPKRDQFLERQEYHKQWKKYIDNFNIKEFLQVIPNPVKFFYIDKVNSKNPLDIPAKFLQHRYKRKCTQYFGYFYNAAKHNLTKTCDIVDLRFPTKPRKYDAWDQKTVFSTSVLQEIAFIQNKKEIAHYLLFKEELKSEAYEKAKTEGTLQECNCCYDEKLSDDMRSCLIGHMYCLSCIKRGSEVVIGNGGTKFPCYSEDCKEEFSFDILKTVLNPEVFSRLLNRKQYEEVNAAGIPGLETCSFCEFCSIPPAEDKLFHCLNPSCMKVTCRSCKKLDHLPLSCEEFMQKDTRQKMQSYVEDKMTEALVRTCWQCGTKFVKENGCNMMQCKCGAKMCYYCRQPVQNYHHFAEGRCGQYMDTSAHDEAAVIKVGKKAKLEVEAANPGYSLANDPTESMRPKNSPSKHKTYYPGPFLI